jgi:hypothetical protein
MNPRSRKSGRWLWGVSLVTGLGLLLWVPVKTMIDVSAVQNAVQRDWEISFGYGNGTGKPAILSDEIDSAAESFLERIFANTRGYEAGTHVTKTRNRDTVYHERFRALFRGSIEEIHIYYFEAFRGDLGAVLARFPKLRRLTVFENDPDLPTELEWTALCARFREFSNLEEVELGGDLLTDAAIAPLAGHPQLRSVTITCGRLTDGCAKTFASMPRLSKLHIEGQTYDGDIWVSEERKAAMRAALPSATVELHD